MAGVAPPVNALDAHAFHELAGGEESHHVGQPRLMRQGHVQGGEIRCAGASAKDRCPRKIEIDALSVSSRIVDQVNHLLGS